MKKHNRLALLCILTTVTLFGCDNAEDDGLSYEIPSSYNFDNVSYTGQTARLNMMEEMTSYMKTGNSGEVLDAQILKNMFANENNPFSSEALNNNTKNIKSKTFELDQEVFEGYMEAIAAASNSAGTTGENGMAGLVTSGDGASTYLFDENGYEYTQIIEKGLMGACFYYQTLGVYLTQERIGPGVDNETVEEGTGTAMEHHWDEAFGYFGVPVDYPSNKEGIRFWGKYADGRNEVLGVGERIMAAYIQGRAAISAGNMEDKNLMASVIYTELELVTVSTAIHYINSALANYTDDAKRNHALSEAWAFINTIQYNEQKAISTEEVLAIRDLLGENFYEVSREDLQDAKAQLATAYSLENTADIL